MNIYGIFFHASCIFSVLFVHWHLHLAQNFVWRACERKCAGVRVSVLQMLTMCYRVCTVHWFITICFLFQSLCQHSCSTHLLNKCNALTGYRLLILRKKSVILSTNSNVISTTTYITTDVCLTKRRKGALTLPFICCYWCWRRGVNAIFQHKERKKGKYKRTLAILTE